jgi:hypothetical protein
LVAKLEQSFLLSFGLLPKLAKISHLACLSRDKYFKPTLEYQIFGMTNSGSKSKGH